MARTGGSWPAARRSGTARTWQALRVLPPTHLIGAVEALPVIERFSARMADRGALYNVDEDVYFAKSADHGFGSLSGPGTACGYDPGEMAELAAQRGGDPDRPGKKDPLDVLVWRAERPAEPGLGFPVRPRQARLARRVRGDRHRLPGQLLRRPGRRL